MIFSCPGKVFIVGEYTCIEGGPSLVGTVAPMFEVRLQKRAGARAVPFAAGSPAGLLLARREASLDGAQLEWRDPYDTPIGVGSSSAQFLLSVAALCELEGKGLPSAAEVLALYWECVGSSQGLRPSGVDVIAQWLGGCVVARNRPFEARRIAPWQGEGEFVLAFTGSKARTHEHLAALEKRGFPGAFGAALDELSAIALKAIDVWEESDANGLGKQLNAYQRALRKSGLAPADFTALVDEASRIDGVWGAKGSGAQGGDCVLLLVRPDKLGSVEETLRTMGWSPSKVRWSEHGVTKTGA